jgi:hypothetical protein
VANGDEDEEAGIEILRLAHVGDENAGVAKGDGGWASAGALRERKLPASFLAAILPLSTRARIEFAQRCGTLRRFRKPESEQ